MTATLPSPYGSKLSKTQGNDGGIRMKNLAHSTGDQTSASRRWFAALLWRAFPGGSEREVAENAARALDVNPRTVVYWLRCENSAALQYVTAVMMISGVELALKKGRQS